MFFKAEVILCLFFGSITGINASENIPAPRVNIKGLPHIICTSPLSYYVDKSQKLTFQDVQNKIFSTQTGGLPKAIHKYLQQASYWIKFSLKNVDSLPTTGFLEPGYFGTIQVYETIRGKIGVLTGGTSVKKNINTPYPESQTVKIRIPPRTTVQYVLRLSSKPDYNLILENVNLLSKKALYQKYYQDYYQNGTFRLLQILFLGFMFSQMLYVGFSRIIGIKRKEYLFYLFYLALVTLYYILRYDDIIGLNWPSQYYPQIWRDAKSVLLALPYLFYLKFIRYFLNVKDLDEKTNNKLIHLEYFIGIYVLIDTTLRFILPRPGILNYILMILIFGIFVCGLTLIIPLIKYKKILVNLILAGSIAAGLGGVIGILISLLVYDFGLIHLSLNTAVSGQIGIVVETIIFTASLSFKTWTMEREKMENQKKLIVQLEENQLLKEKMENTRNKIAQDLHDDIGSTLSSILLYSSAAQKKTRFKNGEAAETFSKISKIANTMMDEMSDIIWAINPVQDSMDKILKRMHYYAAPLILAQNMQFDFKFNEDIKQLHLGLEKRKNLFLIFKESINNALKYSEGTNIFVKLYRTDGCLHMLVKDNGKGFTNPSEIGNGLNNMKIRAEDVEGKLEITSQENDGTTIHVTMPL